MIQAILSPQEIARQLYRFDRVAEILPGPDAITDEHVARYHRDGFLAVASVYTLTEVESAKAALADLIDGKAGPEYKGVQFEPGVDVSGLRGEERELYVRKVMRFVDYEPRLRAMADNARLLAVCRRLVGADISLSQDQALLKPANHGSEKPWHQDAAYFLLEPAEGVVGTWTALDSATAENGCMHFIPGSHRAGLIAHRHVRDCQLPDETVAVDEDVMAPLPPGGTLFFNALVHHGTPPNQSPARRRALQFHYAAAHCRKIDRERHHELFQDGTGHAGCFTRFEG